MLFYHNIAEVYLLVRILVSPLLCLFGWLLLGRAAAKHLQSYVYWFSPSVIGASISAVGLLLEAFASFYARRDYTLFAGVYLLTLAGLPFHLVSFVRLWKTISALPPSTGDTPPRPVEQDEAVWPPQPRRP